MLPPVDGACSDQATQNRSSRERQGYDRERLILDPAPDRRHTLRCSVCYILCDIAGHLTCLLQASATSSNQTLANPICQ